MKARKPGPLRSWGGGFDVAECIQYERVRRVRVTNVPLLPTECTRLAAWLTKAAAWCKEGGQ